MRQAERADFSKLMICQIFSTDVKKAGVGSELYSTIVQFCDNSWKIGTNLNSFQTLFIYLLNIKFKHIKKPSTCLLA